MRQPKGELREKILQVASDLLIERGDFSSVSIDAIVNAVGCTPPALYHYFKTKQELFDAACLRDFELFAIATMPDRSDIDPVDELRERGRAYVDWAVGHPAHYRVLFMTPLLDLSSYEPSSLLGLDGLLDNVERAHRSGALKIADPVEATLVLWTMVHGYAALAVVNPAVPHDVLSSALEHSIAALVASYT